MRRIQRVSKVVKLLAYALSVVSLISAALMGFVLARAQQEPPSYSVIMLYSGALALVMTVVFHQVARLAERYESGELFGLANVRHLRVIGWLIVLTAAQVSVDYDQAAAEFTTGVGFGPGSFVAGLVLIFMSWVMDEARKLDEEHGLTI
ncbi:MAG: DUF2975 domain-containing protein [Myxococcota bacterium]